jgi:glycosyltransferase involved in cell wall biosynthesis
MPVYNVAAYLDEAICSILDQTFRDFEFIIINNGSTDNTSSILEKYRERDSRLRVYYHEQNGWAPAINYACRLARGQYIAMMDGDDFSYNNRFERQLEYLEGSPRIGILGTWVSKLKNGMAAENWCPPASSKTLKWHNFFGVCMHLAAVLMRREVMEKLHFCREDLLHAGDVDFFLRASAITEFGIVPEVLYRYRVRPGSDTQLHLQIVREIHVRLLASFIKEFLQMDPANEAVVGLRKTRVGPPFENLKQIHLTAALIEGLYRNFIKQNALSPEERREISWDAAKRIAFLALQASRFDTRAFMSLSMRALKLNYRLLNPSAIIAR